LLEVHPPHESVHTWTGFLIHIATIVVGLFIAVGLEQAVEFFHHRHQRHQLEAQMHDVFEFDQKTVVAATNSLQGLRSYLVELRAAIIARRAGTPGIAQPAVDDPRMATRIATPSFAPYEAARENGTVALLPADTIRIYNRLGYQRDLLLSEQARFQMAMDDVAAFRERFVDSTGVLEFGRVVIAPDLAQLNDAELAGYLALVATLIKRTDVLIARYGVVYWVVTTVLEGAATEEALLEEIMRRVNAGDAVPGLATIH
jgi:hypothetical protein